MGVPSRRQLTLCAATGSAATVAEVMALEDLDGLALTDAIELLAIIAAFGVLAAVAKQIGSAKLVALEHDEPSAVVSRDLIRAHGLEDVVEIRLAPLAARNRVDQAYSRYATEALEDPTDIGLLLVDGPPGSTGLQARFPAMLLLLPRCGDDAVMVLDDSDRDEEIAVSDRWLAEHPELDRVLRFDRGAHLFTRRVP